MVKNSNIIYYLKLRELGLLSRFIGNIVVLARPNKNESIEMYNKIPKKDKFDLKPNNLVFIIIKR